MEVSTNTMPKVKTNNDTIAMLEKVARTYVNTWIEHGMLTGEMEEKCKELAGHFESFLRRDIRKFAETGKYPEYV